MSYNCMGNNLWSVYIHTLSSYTTAACVLCRDVLCDLQGGWQWLTGAFESAVDEALPLPTMWPH